MSIANKKINATYGDLLYLDNNNSGVDTTVRAIKSGNGNSSALSVATNKVRVRPTADTTSVLKADDKDGNALLTVDSTNDRVLLGISQSHANTNHIVWGNNSIDPDGSNHYGVGMAGSGPTTAVTFGTGTNPVSPTIGTNGDDLVNILYYVDTDIILDSLTAIIGATAATGDTCRLHLANLVQGSTTISSFSSLAVVADGDDIVNAGYEQFYRQSMAISTAAISAGTWLALTFKTDSANSSYSVKAILKYHLA